MKYDFAVVGAIILSAHNGYEPFIGNVCVSGESIARVTTEEISPADCKIIIDGKGKILMPGLTNGHCHGDMTLARGLGDDLTLGEQNEAFADSGWFYKYIDDEDRFYSRQLTYCEALLSGTTFIMENMYWSLGTDSVKAMSQVGIRGALAEDIRVDFAKPDEFVPMEEMARFIDACQEAGLMPIIGSISEEDYDLDRLRRIQAAAGELGVAQTCHLAETTWRIDMVQEKFSVPPVYLLHKNFLLSETLIGSHVVHLTDEEIGFLSETGTKVCNTPLCEMKICDGIAPIPEMVEKGVVVCLGTDGAMWNNSNDIFREMKGMSLLHSINSGIRSLKKKDILDMATINGAKAFGLSDSYGTIETGKKADFILLDATAPHMQPLVMGESENVTSAVVFNATGRDVTDVFINGRHVVDNRKITTVDLDEIISKVQQTAEKLWMHLNKSTEKGNVK